MYCPLACVNFTDFTGKIANKNSFKKIGTDFFSQHFLYFLDFF